MKSCFNGSVSVEELFVETIAKDWNCLFRKFHPSVAFEIIQNNVYLRVTLNGREDFSMYMWLMECIFFYC
jgi:hypothetical protein